MRRRSFGVGLDLRYGDAHGFVHVPGEGDRLSPRLGRFLERTAGVFDHVFFSLQPMDRSLVSPERYFPAWDDVMAAPGLPPVRALHHTMLNLGTVAESVDRGRLLDFTNALIERYGFAWVNEDLGQWSLDGKLLPYPLPPILTEAGLRRAIRHVSEVQSRLAAPLVVEFPGFSEGTNFMLGTMHAHDFFRRLAEETGVAVTLDTGHLLSYQWLLGRRGEELYAELERLPLAHCFEIHCSGCQIIADRFVDVHHGVLQPAQLELTARLLELCPAVRCVTYEDPKVDEAGRLRPKAVAGFERLKALASAWQAGPDTPADRPAPVSAAAPEIAAADVAEATLLRRLLFDRETREAFVEQGAVTLPEALRPLVEHTDRTQLAETARRLAADARTRRTRGVGSCDEVFGDLADENTFDDLLGSPEYTAVDELPDSAAGSTLEEAVFRFLERRGRGDPNARRAAFLAAMARLLALTPEPAFRVPAEFRPTPRGHATVLRGPEGPVLHAALDGRYVGGPVTPAIAERLSAPGPHPEDALTAKLRGLGLLA